MKKPAGAATLVVGLALGVGVIVGVAAKISSAGPPEKSSVASPYVHVGENATSPGSGVNSITGEPLSETSKLYEEHQFNSHNNAVTHP